MPSPLTIGLQKRVAVIGYKSETSLQGWLMSAYHHSNGSKLGSSYYLRVFVCTWSAICSCSSNVSLLSITGTIQYILIHWNVATGRGLELGHAVMKSKEEPIFFFFCPYSSIFLCRRNGSSQGAWAAEGFHVPVLFSLSLSYACNQTLIFEIKNLQDSLLGLLNLQSSLFRMATYLLVNEAIMQLLL